MTYEETAVLINDIELRGRIKVSALKYADSIMIESNTVTGHNTRVRWAQSTMLNPEQTATQLQPPVCMDSAVQSDGKAITDFALQGAVESTVNKML
jgi:hypothetical protein